MRVESQDTLGGAVWLFWGWWGWWGFETAFLYVPLAVLELTVDQADLELRDPPPSASQVLELEV